MKALNINALVVVDDEVANNPFLAEIYRLAMPTHIQVHIRTVSQAVEFDEVGGAGFWNGRRTLVLVKSLDVACRLVEEGFSCAEIQVGGDALQRGLDRDVLLDAMVQRYRGELSYLVSRGVTVYCQGSPSDAKLYLHRPGRA